MKFAKVFIVLIFFVCNIFINSVSYASEFNVNSDAAILVNINTGKILYEKNAYQPMYPASTTKIMTAILTIENCNLEDTLVVSENAVNLPFEYLGPLHAGEELTVKDLLHLLLIVSANDSAIVLAEHIAGNIDNFANMMNQKALELGCKNTHFVNPNGIHDENHYTNCYDLFLIAQYAMQNDLFRDIVSTPSYTIDITNQSPERLLTNTNLLLHKNLKNSEEENIYYCEYAIGIKTGYTSFAKNCLISAGKKDDTEYIAVVLGSAIGETKYSSQRFEDSKNLLSTAINDYTLHTYKHSQDTITTIEISVGDYLKKNLNLFLENDIKILMNNNDLNIELEPQINLYADKLSKHISKNDIIGTVTYTYDGICYTENLLSANDVISKEELILYVKIVVCVFSLIVVILIITFLIKKLKNKLTGAF